VPDVLHKLRSRIARLIAPTPAKRGVRMYGGARQTRTTGSFGGSAGSADAELQGSLTTLRQRSRQMVRDSAYAKRAKTIIVNNVIGPGVGMQGQVMTVRGQLAGAVNDGIEAAWREWCQADQCHTGGQLHFHDMERALMGEVFEAGEALVRIHLRPFGAARVPLALEVIEADRLATDHVELMGIGTGNEVRMGVEVDRFQRPVAYWLRERHSGDIRLRMEHMTDRVERVPADQIFHLRIVSRWPQTRGEPWMHSVLRKLDDLNEYSQHEVTAARASAAYFGTIETPEDSSPLATATEDTDTAGQQRAVMDVEPLTIQELNPGEKLMFHAPNRPNPSLEGFMRGMLREVAAGTGVSYESLSRDYSQSNYSSSRLALLDDRDLYKMLQQWWVRSFRQPLHRLWLRQAVLARAVTAVPLEAYGVEPARYEAVLFKCRGWNWVDPTKEVAAYKEAIKAGLTTLTDVIAATADGRDIEDVIATRKRELEMLREADILTDTEVLPEPAPAPPPQAVAPAPEPEDDAEDSAEDDDEQETEPAARRVVALAARTA
jgi:lambda family phage portal protein